MGIFDDAIREHLELKRHSGADEEELKELEDEAFGPPARPGEPDFPGSTSEEAAVESPPESAGAVFDAETAEESAPAAEAPAPAEADTQLADEAPEAVAPDTAEEPVTPAAEEAASPHTPEAEALEPEVEPGELESDAAVEGETEVGSSSSFTTEEREAIADQPTVFFEQQPPADLELGDLELDLDEEIEEVGGAVEPLADEEPPLEEPAPEPEAAEPGPESAATPAPPETTDFDVPEEAEAAEPATGDEDVLEETPEFLRENPDDDELWFEQGEPKDFDF